jgi:transcription antitermination factor NusG
MATHKPVEVEEFFGDLEPASGEYKWFVVRTKPRREKKLAEYAGKTEINYYLPLRESERIYDRRKIIFTKPLFPGYVFVKCNYAQKRQLTITGHTAHFINVINDRELTDELKNIHFGLQKGAKLSESDFLDKGIKVRITSGSFEGLTGFVKDQKNIKEVILQVNLMQQAVSVVVDPENVEIVR